MNGAKNDGGVRKESVLVLAPAYFPLPEDEALGLL